MDSNTRWALIISAIVVCSVALFVFLIIVIKVLILKKRIKIENQFYKEKEIFSEGHKKVIERKDFLEIDYKLKAEFNNSKISDESIELCVNTIIKNSAKNILVPNSNDGYEILSILKKTDAKLYLFNNSQQNLLLPFIEKNNFLSKVEFILTTNALELEKFDLIILFNSKNYFDDVQRYFCCLKKNSMLIVVNAKKDRKAKNNLHKYLLKNKIRFDLLNWNNGFFLIVKD